MGTGTHAATARTTTTATRMMRARFPRMTPPMAARRAGLSHTAAGPPGGRGTPERAVLLDAYGTLLRLPPPAPRLRALLAAEGHHHPEERVAAAVPPRSRYYRRHHDRGRDAASLAGLRRDCAAVIAAELGGDAPPSERLAEMLVASLRFELMPDALPALDALDALGARLAVVSNWDCSLPRVLSGLGVADRFGGGGDERGRRARRSPTRPSSSGPSPGSGCPRPPRCTAATAPTTTAPARGPRASRGCSSTATAERRPAPVGGSRRSSSWRK